MNDQRYYVPFTDSCGEADIWGSLILKVAFRFLVVVQPTESCGEVSLVPINRGTLGTWCLSRGYPGSVPSLCGHMAWNGSAFLGRMGF